MPDDRRERFLQHVVRVVAIAAEQPTEPVDRRRDEADEPLERTAVARPRRREQPALLRAVRPGCGPRRRSGSQSIKRQLFGAHADPFPPAPAPTSAMTPRPRNHRIVALRATLLAAALALGGCASARTPARPASATTPVDVRVAKPSTTTDAAAFVLPGRVHADEEVTLAARVAARLTRVAAAGARFRAGDVLATFDSPGAAAALAAARTALAAATARRDRARMQAARLDSLYAASVVATSDVELAQVDRRGAEAAYDAAAAALAQWTEGTRLAVPFAGVVVRRRADAGEALQPGAPVLDVRSDGAREVVVAVPESRLDAVAVAGAPAAIAVGDAAWRPAVLAHVDGMTDAATRTRMAHFTAADGGAMEPGAYARVRLGPRHTGPSGTSRLTVPASALVRRGGLAGVYVVADGRARLRWLRLGDADGERAEVLAGLWPADEVALDPSRLTDGAPVRAAR